MGDRHRANAVQRCPRRRSAPRRGPSARRPRRHPDDRRSSSPRRSHRPLPAWACALPRRTPRRDRTIRRSGTHTAPRVPRRPTRCEGPVVRDARRPGRVPRTPTAARRACRLRPHLDHREVPRRTRPPQRQHDTRGCARFDPGGQRLGAQLDRGPRSRPRGRPTRAGGRVSDRIVPAPHLPGAGPVPSSPQRHREHRATPRRHTPRRLVTLPVRERAWRLGARDRGDASPTLHPARRAVAARSNRRLGDRGHHQRGDPRVLPAPR